MMTPSTDAVTLVSRSPKGSAATPSTSPLCTGRPRRAEDAARGRTYPRAALCHNGLAVATPPRLAGGEHLECVHHVHDTAHTDVDGGFVETQGLARFVQQHRQALTRHHFTQRTFAHWRIQQHRHAKAAGEARRLLVVEIGAYLRQIGAVQG